ncbi:hypothetical protein ACWDUL_20890 [Nocardia niigatensis]
MSLHTPTRPARQRVPNTATDLLTTMTVVGDATRQIADALASDPDKRLLLDPSTAYQIVSRLADIEGMFTTIGSQIGKWAADLTDSTKLAEYGGVYPDRTSEELTVALHSVTGGLRQVSTVHQVAGEELDAVAGALAGMYLRDDTAAARRLTAISHAAVHVNFPEDLAASLARTGVAPVTTAALLGVLSRLAVELELAVVGVWDWYSPVTRDFGGFLTLYIKDQNQLFEVGATLRRWLIRGGETPGDDPASWIGELRPDLTIAEFAHTDPRGVLYARTVH